MSSVNQQIMKKLKAHLRAMEIKAGQAYSREVRRKILALSFKEAKEKYLEVYKTSQTQ